MVTAGVDLAAQESGTAVASIRWSGAQATVEVLELGVGDDRIIAAVAEAGLSGIDCPFGWPEPFVDFLVRHRSGNAYAPEGVTGADWRRTLAYRATDRAVREAVGRWPLSVSADRIAHPAMRCANLLARLADRGVPVDRAGGGAVVEVYPAASLHRWGLAARSYKGRGNGVALGGLVDALLQVAPWLDLGPHESLCRRSDDATDAVVAALTARAAHLGLTRGPADEDAKAARTEGWIMLPDEGSLGRLPVGTGP